MTADPGWKKLESRSGFTTGVVNVLWKFAAIPFKPCEYFLTFFLYAVEGRDKKWVNHNFRCLLQKRKIFPRFSLFLLFFPFVLFGWLTNSHILTFRAIYSTHQWHFFFLTNQPIVTLVDTLVNNLVPSPPRRPVQNGAQISQKFVFDLVLLDGEK